MPLEPEYVFLLVLSLNTDSRNIRIIAGDAPSFLDFPKSFSIGFRFKFFFWKILESSSKMPLVPQKYFLLAFQFTSYSEILKS